MLVEPVEFGMELRIVLGFLIGLFQLKDQRHQRFGDITAAENPEISVLVRSGAEGIGFDWLGHAVHSVWVASLPICLRPATSLSRRLGFRQKAADEVVVLDARRALDTGRNVDAGRADHRQRGAQVGQIDPSRKHVIDVRVKRGQQRPVKGHAIAAGQFGAGRRLGVEQEAVGNAEHRRRCLSRSSALRMEIAFITGRP